MFQKNTLFQLGILGVAIFSIWYLWNSNTNLKQELKEKDEAIVMIQQGYETALKVQGEEITSQTQKEVLEANTKLKKAINKRGEIEVVQNNDNDFISFGF